MMIHPNVTADTKVTVGVNSSPAGYSPLVNSLSSNGNLQDVAMVLEIRLIPSY